MNGRSLLWAAAILVMGIAFACDAPMTPGDPPPPLVFETRLPRALAAAGPEAAAQLLQFDRVRITFRRLTGVVALDTVFTTQPDVDSVAVRLNIPLALDVPALGETMTITVTCIDADGNAVYRGGPAIVLVHPGASPAPVVIQLAYVGAGSVASTIRIVPDALSVLLGQPFAFTAAVFDQNGAEISGVPIVWSVAEPSLARLTSPLGGIGVALGALGVAHIVAQVPDGPADTAALTIQPLTDLTRVLQLVSGGGQNGLIGVLLGAPVVVRVVNAAGDAIAGVSVNFSPSNGGTVGTASVMTDANGRAQTSWTLGSLVGAQALTATIAGETGSALSIPATGLALPPPLATALQFTSALASGIAGTVLGPVVVRAVDDAGHVVPSFTNTVTIALGPNSGGASLLGTRTVTPVNGVATFTNLSLNLVASGYTLVATASGVTSATSNAFDISHALASALSLVGGNNQTGIVGAVLGAPLAAKVTDPFDNPVPGVTVAWGLLSGGGLLGNATSQTNANGVASNTWALGLLPGIQRITASVTGLSGSPLTYSATATLLPPVATQLVMSAVPTIAVAGAAIGTISVSAIDNAENAVASFANSVTVALGKNPGAATLSGTRTAPAVNGVATFTNLSLDKAASGYTLVATATGLTNATSTNFAVTHAAASALSLGAGNNQTGLVSALLGNALTAKVTDPFDNPVPGVTVAWGVSAGGGLMGSATTQTNSSGIASNSWTLGAIAGVQRATASAASLAGSPVTYTATATGLAPVATTLTMATTLTSIVAGMALQTITVSATDGAGTLVTTFANNVTIALANNPGDATLSGARTVRAVNGVATFTGLSLDKAASGYTLVATSSGLSGATSGTFTITHAAAAILSVAGGDGQSGLLSVLLPAPLQVRVTDVYANVVPGVSVSWGVTLGGGLLGNPTSQTNASGVATNTWTLGLLLGLQHVTAAVSGLSGSPATFSASALLGRVEELGP